MVRDNFIDSWLSVEEKEEFYNFKAMHDYFGKGWTAHIFMTTALADLARAKGLSDLAEQLNLGLDLTAAKLGLVLRQNE